MDNKDMYIYSWKIFIKSWETYGRIHEVEEND